MSGYVNKEENGKWSVQFRVEDCTGKKERVHKRGFATQREAKQWMEEYRLKQKCSLNMTFESFYKEYEEMHYTSLRDSTVSTKKHIVELHILPYFKDMRVVDIMSRDIVKWQNEVKKKGFSDTYLRSINAQLSAIFNYAVKYYNLGSNPCNRADLMGKSKSGNMGIWSQDDFEKFLDAERNKPEIYYAFLFMYWTGVRVGELLALNIEDVDFEKHEVVINKSLNRVNGKDIITKPKTDAGIRVIPLPEFLLEELREYIGMLYGRTEKDRLFLVTKSHLEKEIHSGADAAGLKNIRVHDLRHSHASLLIANGVDIATISKRLGHEKIGTTMNTYGHMFKGKAHQAADILDKIHSGVSGNEEED